MATETYFRKDPDDSLWREIEDKKMVIDTLPPKGKKIAEQMGDKLKLTEDAEVVYENIPATGSPLLLLMNWYLNKKEAKEKPLDADLFEELIKQSVPKRWIKVYDKK